MGKILKSFLLIVSFILAVGAGFGAGWIVKDYIEPQESISGTYAFRTIDYVWAKSATEADKANVGGMSFDTFDGSLKSMYKNMSLTFKEGGEVGYSNSILDIPEQYRATGDWEQSRGKVIVTLYSIEDSVPSKYTFEIINGGIRFNFIDFRGRADWEKADKKCTDVYVVFKAV